MEASIAYQANRVWSPPPPLTLSQWSDEYRTVSIGPYPGRWVTDRTPDLREPMDCVTDLTVEGIVVVKPTRIGGTDGPINNAIGYHVHFDPCDILYAQSSKDQGELYSDAILMPMIRDTHVLSELLVREAGRKATQTKTKKFFNGGAHLRIIGAKSPKGFQAIQARVAIGDDLDEWEQSKFGDPVQKLIDRTKGIWNRKIILISFPTTEGVSRIWSQFERTDQRHRYVPCPLCGEMQILRFGGKDTEHGLKWDSRTSDPYYVCEFCHGKIQEFHKNGMNAKGEWRAHKEFNGWAGFKLNPFLRSWHRWSEIRDTFLASIGDRYKLMVFTNQTLGEIWKESPDDTLTDDELFNRREAYPAEVPMGTLIMAASVDVQDKYVEIEVKGWGPGEESWGIEHKVINGAFLDQSTQVALDNALLKTYRHESGLMMPIKVAAIDSGGHYTSQVYEFCRNREARNIYAVKGSNVGAADVIDGAIRQKGQNKFQMVGVSACKEILYGRLKIKSHGPGFMHFPMNYDKEFFTQLLSEKPVAGKTGKREWKVMPGKRNEAVDLHSYNLAALRMYNPDWELLKIQGIQDDLSRKIYRNHKPTHCDGAIELKKELPIALCCTFGVNPLVWVLAQTDGKRAWVFDEIALRNADTSQMAAEVRKRYGNHPAGFVVYGSAIGTVRASAGKTEYAILRDFGFGRQKVKSTNPLPIDVYNAMNNMLEDMAGQSRISYHPRCIMLKKDFDYCITREDGEMDRTEFGRGIAAEALGYFINYEFPLQLYKASPSRKFWK